MISGTFSGVCIPRNYIARYCKGTICVSHIPLTSTLLTSYYCWCKADGGPKDQNNQLNCQITNRYVTLLHTLISNLDVFYNHAISKWYEYPEGFLRCCMIQHIKFKNPSYSRLIQNGREWFNPKQGYRNKISSEFPRQPHTGLLGKPLVHEPTCQLPTIFENTEYIQRLLIGWFLHV